jgi:hypothetical protein
MAEGSSAPIRVIGAVMSAIGLAGAAGVLGFVLGRGTAPAAGARQSAPPPGPGPRVGPVSGPSRFTAGVPVGYAATRDGAVAAATAYQQYLFGALLLRPQELRAAVDAVAAPERRDVLVAKVGAAAAVLEQQFQVVTAAAHGVPTAVLTFPMTTQVMSYDAENARVRIYTCTVLAEKDVLAPSTVWGTVVVTLRRTRDDWQLVDSGVDASTPAVIPSVQGTPGTAAVVPPQLGAFQQYIYAPPAG